MDNLVQMISYLVAQYLQTKAEQEEIMKKFSLIKKEERQLQEINSETPLTES